MCLKCAWIPVKLRLRHLGGSFFCGAVRFFGAWLMVKKCPKKWEIMKAEAVFKQNIWHKYFKNAIYLTIFKENGKVIVSRLFSDFFSHRFLPSTFLWTWSHFWFVMHFRKLYSLYSHHLPLKCDFHWTWNTFELWCKFRPRIRAWYRQRLSISPELIESS